ncbi:ABC-2 type transport system ATP-binding protein [Ferrithrix thermotolerans DSM 19514]|uniref:ABC-2 type transport system ATP-binding protein n=1 Tax=Ferrithrix thermotolerans DSM 19514 TaxID=1121881 RepID=A0A1M4TYL8_9ACTN|nr:ABC transporter ATP-binding protein [Ferrithrix thermotolerans]SHE49588.1 ABC-2 type transport system ATP-binding protein [Ferrithrix thermotolerans DSM 19514]
MAVIEVSDLRVSYGSKEAVSGLSFETDYGQIFIVLGPNGAGKSTTIETLEGFRSPSQGKVTILGLDPKKQQRELGKLIGVMLQGGGVNPRMTPSQALTLFAGYYDNPIDPAELERTLELEHVRKTPFRRLSGGEKQRLLLALAVIGRPKVVFLDEPTSGVDPAGRIAIRELIARLRAEGVAIILTTHELGEAEKLADKLLIISQGKKVAYGDLGEIKAQHSASQITFRSADEIDPKSFEEHLNVALKRPFGNELYVVEADGSPELIANLARYLADQGIGFSDLSTSSTSLEDIYLSITSKADA